MLMEEPNMGYPLTVHVAVPRLQTEPLRLSCVNDSPKPPYVFFNLSFALSPWSDHVT